MKSTKGGWNFVKFHEISFHWNFTADCSLRQLYSTLALHTYPHAAHPTVAWTDNGLIMDWHLTNQWGTMDWQWQSGLRVSWERYVIGTMGLKWCGLPRLGAWPCCRPPALHTSRTPSSSSFWCKLDPPAAQQGAADSGRGCRHADARGQLAVCQWPRSRWSGLSESAAAGAKWAEAAVGVSAVATAGFERRTQELYGAWAPEL